MACPKGWEALTPLARARPGHRRRCCATSAGPAASRSTGTTALDTFVDALQGDPGRARPRVGRVPRHRPDRRPRRWRCSARSPSSAWAWCTATATPASAWPPRSSPTSRRSASTRRPTPTPTSRSPTSSCWSARTCASPTRSCGSASAATRTSPRSSSIDPRTTETAHGGHPAPTPCAPKSDLALLYGLAHLLIERGWIDRDFVDAHTTGFDEFAAHVAAVHARAGRARDTGLRGRAPSSGWRA